MGRGRKLRLGIKCTNLFTFNPCQLIDLSHTSQLLIFFFLFYILQLVLSRPWQKPSSLLSIVNDNFGLLPNTLALYSKNHFPVFPTLPHKLIKESKVNASNSLDSCAKANTFIPETFSLYPRMYLTHIGDYPLQIFPLKNKQMHWFDLKGHDWKENIWEYIFNNLPSQQILIKCRYWQIYKKNKSKFGKLTI